MTVKHLRWIVIGLVAFAALINYIDRNALAVMWPSVSKDLGLDKDDYALLLSFFMVSYAIGQSAFGKIFDALGTRLSFAASILVWSLSIGLHALARGLPALCALRATLAFGEAGNWPGATKASAEWFPVKERALAQGIFNAGASAGAVISAPLVACLYLAVGWQFSFVLIGALGLIWVVPWLVVYKASPAAHRWLGEAERTYILEGQRAPAEHTAAPAYAPGWLQLLRHRQSWAVIVSRFFLDPVWWLFVSWLPIYLAETFNFDIKQIGLFGWVPYVGATLGSLIGGWWAGRLIRRGWSTDKARKLVIVAGGALMLPALLLTIVAATPLYAVLLIAVILCGFQMAIGNIQTLPSDYFSGGAVGSLAGLGGTSAVLGVLGTIWLVPVLTRVSYAPFFILGAALVPLSILSIFVLGGRIEPVRSRARDVFPQELS